MTRINSEAFINALEGTGGVQSDIARKLNIHRSTITKYLNKNPKMLELVEQERQKLIDVAENVFKETLSLKTQDPKNGPKIPEKTKRERLKLKLKAAEKIVTTLGKDRGWIAREQRELSGDVSVSHGPIKINVIMPKNNVKKTSEKEGSKEGQPKEEKKITDRTDTPKES